MEPLYKDLSYEIVGAAFEVHNELGCGFLEKVYQEAFAIALRERDINFEREKRINIFFTIIHSPHPTSVIFVWKIK